MPRTTRSILLVPFLAAALFSAGCSSVVPGAAAPAGAPAASDPAVGGGAASTDDPVAWVDDVCGALLPFVQTASQQPALDSSGDPEQLVKGLSDYLGKASDAAGTAVDGLNAAGPSPVAQGDELVKGLTDALTTFQTTFSGVKADIDKLDTSNPAALASGLPQAIGPLQELSNLADPTAQLKSTPELDAAAEKAANCQEIEKLN